MPRRAFCEPPGQHLEEEGANAENNLEEERAYLFWASRRQISKEEVAFPM